jgi:large subunit ribosomal protein L35Ae
VSTITKGTKGVITEFARSRRVQQNLLVLLRFPSVDDLGKASKLIGRTVVWISPSEHKLRGKIVGPHGKNGTVKARFRHGVPSQGIGTEIAIE